MIALINGIAATRFSLSVPEFGCWLAELTIADAVALSGQVSLEAGPSLLRGSVVESGTFALTTKSRIVAGAGGWAKRAGRKHYHNDAGVKGSTILTGLASEVGETIIDLPDTRVGADYVRPEAPAGRTLNGLTGGLWWVGFDGITRLGSRPSFETEADLISFDPRESIAELVVDDWATVLPGAVLRGRLDRPQQVRALEVTATGERVRGRAWCREVPS